LENFSNYKTVSSTGESMYRVSGSKHIGLAYEVYSEQEIKGILDKLWRSEERRVGKEC
jgi:hypothetical protein